MNMTPFTNFAGGYIVAQGDIDPAQIRAGGNTSSPVLTLPLSLSFRAPLGLSLVSPESNGMNSGPTTHDGACLFTVVPNRFASSCKVPPAGPTGLWRVDVR
jgi:hypothetical protein